MCAPRRRLRVRRVIRRVVELAVPHCPYAWLTRHALPEPCRRIVEAAVAADPGPHGELVLFPWPLSEGHYEDGHSVQWRLRGGVGRSPVSNT